MAAAGLRVSRRRPVSSLATDLEQYAQPGIAAPDVSRQALVRLCGDASGSVPVSNGAAVFRRVRSCSPGIAAEELLGGSAVGHRRRKPAYFSVESCGKLSTRADR